MEAELFVNTVTALMGLLFIAAVSALLLKKIHFPYTVGLVLIGIALSFVSDGFPALSQGLDTLKLSPLLIMFIFIPILIFESAFGTDVRLLLKNLVPTMILAAPGLLLSTALIGAIIYFCTPLPLGSALVFGCLISATDPVAVIALFKDVGAPKRLTILVEGESLFNDATAIVTFQIIMAVIATGILDLHTISAGIADFFIVFFGGLIIGLGFGHLLARAIRSIGDEPLVHITLTLVVAYTAFIVSEHFLHTSGIMAVLGAGLVIGYYGPALYSERVREYLEVFWENAAFVANSLIFLMLGLSEKVFLTNVNGNMSGLLLPVLTAIVAAIGIRALVVFGMVPLVNKIPGQAPVDKRYQTVMFWGGLRGAVAVALAMSLPSTFPFRWQIIDLAFGVTFFTLLVNGTTMSWLIRRLGLHLPSPLTDYIESFVRVESKKSALARLRDPRRTAGIDAAVLRRQQQLYQNELDNAVAHLNKIRNKFKNAPDIRRKLLWLRAFEMQTTSIHEQYEDNLLGLGSLRELEWELRNQEMSIKDGMDKQQSLSMPNLISSEKHKKTFFNKLLPGRNKKMILRMYEETSALIAAARTVLAGQEELQQFSEADHKDIKYMMQYYRRLIDKAEKRLTEIAQQLNEVSCNVQERMLGKLARDGEQDVLKAYAMHAVQVELIAEHLEQQMQSDSVKE